MTVPDFAAIIDDYTDWDTPGNASMVLTAKVTELCRTCGGGGCAALGPNGHDGPCRPCPDCPTIAKLLAVGAAVMSAEVVGVCIQVPGRDITREADILLDYLRAVQP